MLYDEESRIYNCFALDLAHGISVVDRESHEIIIDSRRKQLLKCWLSRKRGLFLDYGCGSGGWSNFIEEELNMEVVGVDLSKGMVRYASSRSEGCQRVTLLVADCHILPFKSESFDVIIGFSIFHHLDLRTALFECNRLLRKGGILVACEPNSLSPVAFIGRKFFRTKIHTPGERPCSPWSFINEMKSSGFRVVNLVFLSFLGFIFPFIWASKFGYMLYGLKRYATYLKIIDQLFERIPIIKFFCWLFMALGIKE